MDRPSRLRNEIFCFETEFSFRFQLFVGIVNRKSFMYLWDQFFLLKWNHSAIELAATAILYLLRDRFMLANDYEQMRKVRSFGFLNFTLRRDKDRVQTFKSIISDKVLRLKARRRRIASKNLSLRNKLTNRKCRS